MSSVYHLGLQLINILELVHNSGLVHNDVKLDNMMLTAHGHIKLVDFGMCKDGMFGSARTTTFCGTPGYLSPEVVKEEPYVHAYGSARSARLMYPPAPMRNDAR